MFNQVLLGETPSSDPSNLMGRIVEATVHDLTGDFSKMHVKLTFKVKEVRGFDAHTMFIGQTLTSDYVRRLTRRKRTKTDHVIDVRTKDGYLLRIKPMSVTDKRIQSSQETAVRNAMTKEVTNMGIEMTMADMVKVIITGEMSKRLSNAAKVIVPIKRVEVRKTEVLEMGEGGQDVSIVPQPEPEVEEQPAEPTVEEPAATEESAAEEEISAEGEEK
jgi:small subunit ribosomal protein S3Ae